MFRLRIVTAGVCVAVVTTCTPDVLAQPQPYIDANVVASDARETRGFIDALDRFDVTLDQAQRKATLSEVELRAVQAEADRLKALVPRAQRATAAMIANLKAAGKWTPELETFIEDHLKAKGLASLAQNLRANGGVRATLEKAASVTYQVGPEVDKQIKTLRRPGLGVRLLQELLGRPVDAGLIRTYLYCNFALPIRAIDCAVSGDASACEGAKSALRSCLS